jgi:hypothetical protein
VFRKNRYLCSATVLRSPPQGADRGDQMGIGCESRTVPAAVCSCFPLRGANVCDTLLPLTSGSGRRRRRNESEDLPLRLNFVLPFLASAIRVNSVALGLTKWLNFSSISRLGNSSKLDCARLDEMVGNLRLRVTGESRKRLLGSNRIEREAAPANVRGGTKRLSTIRYSGSEFRGRIFRFGISGPRGERTETYLPTRLSGERRRD